MRTMTFIVIGLCIAMVAMKFAPGGYRAFVAGLFTLGWLVVSTVNMRAGLSLGYGLFEELALHTALFGIPTAVAWAIYHFTRAGH